MAREINQYAVYRLKRDRKEETANHCTQSSDECTKYIAENKHTETGTQSTTSLGYACCHQYRHQHGGDSFQRTHKHLSENGKACPFRHDHSKNSTNHQTY